MSTLLVSTVFFFLVVSGTVEAAADDKQVVKAYSKFVPEREDDFTWENDRVAFRMYGPASTATGPASGVDCWLKRVNYSVIDKWYENYSNKISYHIDHGEGYDPYHTGISRGCGGTAIWVKGEPEPAGTFKRWRILTNNGHETSFELDYEWQTSLGEMKETKRIALALGEQLYRVSSQFWLNGKPASGIEVAIGLSTHDGKAVVSLNRHQGWIATWEKFDQHYLGTAALVAPDLIEQLIEQESQEKDKSHIWLIARTDNQGKLTYRAGYGWERAGQFVTEKSWQEYLNIANK